MSHANRSLHINAKETWAVCIFIWSITELITTTQATTSNLIILVIWKISLTGNEPIIRAGLSACVFVCHLTPSQSYRAYNGRGFAAMVIVALELMCQVGNLSVIYINSALIKWMVLMTLYIQSPTRKSYLQTLMHAITKFLITKQPTTTSKSTCEMNKHAHRLHRTFETNLTYLILSS